MQSSSFSPALLDEFHSCTSTMLKLLLVLPGLKSAQYTKSFCVVLQLSICELVEMWASSCLAAYMKEHNAAALPLSCTD